MKIGIIGMNDGNGHPYSYSALFNGYDPKSLRDKCPFPLIKEYLPLHHKNENFIEGAKVTHIWTQSISISKQIADVSLIPNIVNNLEDMTDKVDAVILARDDPWNHLEMARPFLEKGLPIFIDKQLTSTFTDLQEFDKLTGPEYPIMAGSSMRFSRDVVSAKLERKYKNVLSVHGVSRVSWMRYGHHLLEGIVVLWGYDILWVRSLSDKIEHDIIQICFKNGLNVILEFIKDLHLPIQFTCFSENDNSFSVPFQDFFHSFREMLKAFVHMVGTGQKTIEYSEIISIAKVILAGDISKQKGGIPISPITLDRFS